MSAYDEPVTLPLACCARCGGEHDAVDYQVLERPIYDVDGDFTHWAPCPTNGEPILMRWIESEDG